MPRGDQLSRQWRLLQLLGRPEGLAVAHAAREVRCTVRTVWRDLPVLQDAGFPLSLPEIVALLVSVDLLGAGGAGPSGPAAAAALAKIRALLTPRALELVDRMRAGVGARTIGAKVQLVSGGLYLVGYCHLRREVRVFAVERLERDETRWITWERYSGRQDRRMEWAGVVGAVTYRGDLKPFWPYLVFGQWTHAGSGTTFGLSGYRIEP